MAITIVGTPQVGQAANGGNVTLTFSVTPSQNDMVIVFGGCPRSGSAPAAPGTGYTQIQLYSVSGLFFGVWYKIMGASPDSSVVCNGGGSSLDAVAYGCYVLRGIDTSTPMDATATTAGPTSGTNPNAASITTVTNGAWVIPVTGSVVDDAAITVPSGYSNHYTTHQADTASFTIAGATLEKTTAGAEDPASWTVWASGEWYAITIAVRPAVTASSDIVKINGIALASIAKILGVAIAGISKINGVSIIGGATEYFHTLEDGTSYHTLEDGTSKHSLG